MENKFSLRKLQEKDAPFMLEWMHDEDVVSKLQNDFLTKTLADCLVFIKEAENEEYDLHLAIVDAMDEYLGTVSLKHITTYDAEFAITIRKKAMGTDCAIYAMKEIIKKGLYKLELTNIYWCVSSDNKRALRFYDKNGYERVLFKCLSIDKEHIRKFYDDKQLKEYIWYQVMR